MDDKTLQKIFPTLPRAVCLAYAGPLQAAMQEFEVNTRLRQAAFLAQLGHESQDLTRLVENLNYSAARLVEVFPKYFTSSLALQCARQPQRIANRIYANRMGNGNEASGDGWKFRGHGGIQRTGRDNFARAAEALNLPLLDDPDLLLKPEHAFRSDALFWSDHRLNEMADHLTDRLSVIDAITHVINGGYNGREDRRARYVRALEQMSEARG